MPLVGDAVGVWVVAAAAGIHALDRRPLWMDEALDVQWTHLGWADLFNLIARSEMGQSLYLVLLKPWLSIAGHGELAARVPSVVFTASACALLVPVGRTLLGSRFAGVAAGLLLASNAFIVTWQQQARAYGFALLVAVLVTYLFLRAVSSNGWRRWIIYGLVAGLGVYAHVFVGLVVVAHFTALLVARRRCFGRPAFYAAVIVVLVALPAGAFALSVKGAQDRIPPLTIDRFRETMYGLSGSSVVFLVLTITGLAMLTSRPFRVRAGRWPPTVIACWLVVPITLCAFLSAATPLFLDRYLIVVVPAAALCGAFALSRAGPLLGSVALALVVVSASTHVADWYRSPFWNDWRAAAAFVDSTRTPGEHLVVFPAWLEPVAAYYMKSEPDTRRLTGAATWVVTVPDRKASVEESVRKGGYTVAAVRSFPGVLVIKAVRPAD